MTRTRDSKSLDGNIMGCDHWPMSNVGKCAQSPVSPSGPHHCQLSWRTGPHKYRGRPLDHTHCRAGLILIYDSIPTIWKPLTSELSLCPNYNLTLLRVKLLYWSGHAGGWRITQYWSWPRGGGWAGHVWPRAPDVAAGQCCPWRPWLRRDICTAACCCRSPCSLQTPTPRPGNQI